MGATIPCFITKNGQVFSDLKSVKDDYCLEYIFNLENRNFYYNALRCTSGQNDVVPSWAQHLWMYDIVANDFFDNIVGTPEKLMDFALKGNLDKASLVSLLEPRIRKIFLDICAVLEKEATDRCKNSGDPCLEDGCAFEGTDDVCLNAVLMSEGKCLKLCIEAWICIFTSPEDRIKVWRS